MATEFCPECHQPIKKVEIVAGVRMTIFKVGLFHYIKSHPGQSGNELAQHFGKKSEHTIRSHIVQINDALMNTKLRIRGDKFTGYHVLDR